MKDGKILVNIGAVISGAAVLFLVYNFYDMYSLVGKCEGNSTQQCQAYANWDVANQVVLIALVMGVVILVSGLVLHHQNKR